MDRSKQMWEMRLPPPPPPPPPRDENNWSRSIMVKVSFDPYTHQMIMQNAYVRNHYVDTIVSWLSAYVVIT